MTAPTPQYDTRPYINPMPEADGPPARHRVRATFTWKPLGRYEGYPTADGDYLVADGPAGAIALDELAAVLADLGLDWLRDDGDDYLEMIREKINNQLLQHTWVDLGIDRGRLQAQLVLWGQR